MILNLKVVPVLETGRGISGMGIPLNVRREGRDGVRGRKEPRSLPHCLLH
jgi:hypothetical protein